MQTNNSSSRSDQDLTVERAPVTDPYAPLPCAFCRAGPSSLSLTHDAIGRKYLVCASCGKVGPGGRSEGEAIAAWNSAPWRQPMTNTKAAS